MQDLILKNSKWSNVRAGKTMCNEYICLADSGNIMT